MGEELQSLFKKLLNKINKTNMDRIQKKYGTNENEETLQEEKRVKDWTDGKRCLFYRKQFGSKRCMR